MGDSMPGLYVTPHMDLYIKQTAKSGSDYSVGAIIDERLVIDEDSVVDRIRANQCYYTIIYRSKYFETSIYTPVGQTVFEYGLVNGLKVKQKALQEHSSIMYRGLSKDLDFNHVRCMGLINQQWNATVCETRMFGEPGSPQMVIECYCRSEDT